MRKTQILVAGITLSILMCACAKKEKNIETNGRGVPMTVANIIMGDTYKIDTLYNAPGLDVIFIDNPDYLQHLMYINDEIVANGPWLSVDSLSSNVYEVSDLIRNTRVNFASMESVDKFKHMFPQYPEFKTVAVGDTSQVGQKSLFSFVMSEPTDKVKHKGEIMRWIESCIDDTMKYNPNTDVYIKDIEQKFFEDWDEEESDWTYVDCRSMLVYAYTPEYVTYHDFFFVFMGGAHGMYGDRFVSYSLTDDCPVTTDYLLNPEYYTEIRELIYEAIAEDDDFMENHKLTSLSQARTYIQHNLEGQQLPIPTPGLLPEGVVFCYEPYEIASFADGVFTLVIPYDKIAPYLNINPTEHNK